jgi:hypothetical protein
MARSNPTPAEIAQAVRDRGAVAFPGFFASRTLLSRWFDHRVLRKVAELNPFGFLLRPRMLAGRKATGGTARAN